MELSDIINSEALANLSPEKKLFLNQFAAQSAGKSQNDMLPLMMAAMKAAEKKGLNFTSEESQLLIQILKQNMNESELKSMNLLLSLFQNR